MVEYIFYSDDRSGIYSMGNGHTKVHSLLLKSSLGTKLFEFFKKTKKCKSTTLGESPFTGGQKPDLPTYCLGNYKLDRKMTFHMRKGSRVNMIWV